MVDNVAITPGTGATVAADDIGGVLHQRVKVSIGADGTAADWPVGSGNQSAVPRVTIATDSPGVTALGQTTKAASLPVTMASDQYTAHDAVDAGNPIKVGYRALAHGANPTAVAAGDRTDAFSNRHGVPWVIGGHPNVLVRACKVDDADGAQTDASLAGAIGAGTKVVITQIWVKADKNNSGNVAVKIGFGTANVPTPALTGVAGLIVDEDLGAGEGHQIGNGAGIVAIGADGEELRLTCDDPAGGRLTLGFSYYTIES
jgi:hypothetical protein